jgi:3-deoxy-D-manno-octulosonic-acid transferase
VRIVFLLYNIAATVGCLFAAPWLLPKYMLRERGIHRERWGTYPPTVGRALASERVIWIHAASVGEVGVTVPLVRALRDHHPSYTVFLSTTTPQGRGIAAHIPGVEAAVLAPVDLPWVVARVLRSVHPTIVLVAETELWPNLLRTVRAGGIPVILFNGRISARSYRRYRFVRFLFRQVLRQFSALCVKSCVDRDRMVDLGADPADVYVTGDLKFHQSANAGHNRTEKFDLRAVLKLPRAAPIMIAGSTHAGEEQVVIRVFKELRRSMHELVLILAPRHLHRISEVEHILQAEGLTWVRRSTVSQAREVDVVLLLDTVGELAEVYAVGDAIFVGGSFCDVGGHNILEVLAHGKGVVFGPKMENFAEAARATVEAGAGIQVTSPDELMDALLTMLTDTVRSHEMGSRGRELVLQHQGALQTTVDVIARFMPGS